MLEIIKIITPLFSIIVLGYCTLLLRLINKEQLNALGVYVIKVALPCLLVVNISAQNIAKILQPQYLISYGSASFLLFTIILFFYRYYFHQALNKAALMALGASASNTGFIGSPILHLILGDISTVYFAMTLMVENFVVLMMFLTCQELVNQCEQDLPSVIKKTLTNILTNPLILSLILGIGLSLIQLQLPLLLKQALEPIGKTAGPIGLFVVGGSLYGINNLKNIWLDASLIIIGKMMIMPLLVYLIFWFMPNTNPQMVFAGVLLSSVSMATMFSIFGQSLEMGGKSSAILLISTLLNLLSVPIITTLLLPH